jgi:hypothetical protein
MNFRIIVISLLLVGCGTGRTLVMTTTSTVAPLPTPTDNQPKVPEAWNTLNHDGYVLRYPSAYYTVSTDPVILIADSKTTYDSWMQDGAVDSNRLLIQLTSLALDRRLDPDKDPSQLATPEQALRREINRTVGVSRDVSGSTDVPWENAGGETYDGRKVFYPSVPYENTMLGATGAAKVIGDNEVLYFILPPNEESDYLRIIVQPANSVLT